MGEEKVKPKFEAVKITNVHWLGVVAPFIKSFLDKVEIPGIHYETLYTYLANIVQNGHLASQRGTRDTSEFWCVFEDGKVVAFASWHITMVPVVGCVYCDFVHSWQTKKIPVQMLADEFVRFGKDMRAKYWKGDAINDRVYEVLKNCLEKNGLSVNKTPMVHLWAEKK